MLWTLILIASTFAFAQAEFLVNEPSAKVYEIASLDSDLEDIIPYGTAVRVIEQRDEWVYVTYKSWHGWLKFSDLVDVELPPDSDKVYIGSRGAYIFSEMGTSKSPFFELPFEVPVKLVSIIPDSHNRWLQIELQDGKLGYVQTSQVSFKRPLVSLEEMLLFSQQFIGLKYLYGGTTSFGYDCSGFVQMLYRQIGVDLPRNARDQINAPCLTEISMDRAEGGDLVFFANEKGRVVHVAMMINDKEFIHSFTRESAWICIHSLDDPRFDNGHFYFSKIIKRLSY